MRGMPNDPGRRARLSIAAALLAPLVLGACSSGDTSSTTEFTPPSTTLGDSSEVNELVDLRDRRYCEIIAVNASEGSTKADVYNTIGLNECPEDLFQAMDTAVISEQIDASLAVKNGPRHWTLDTIQVDLSKLTDREVVNLDGLEMRKAATVDISGLAAGERTPYTGTEVDRTTAFVFNKGTEIYRLTSDNGTEYVMQSYSLEVDPEMSSDDLATLGDRLTLPEGWSFEAVELDEELHVLSDDGVATVIQDDFQNSYQLAAQP